MYHTVFPSQMMVQIMGGHQTNGQCPPAQAHTLHLNGVNALHQSDFPQYGPNISGHNRHRTIQVHFKQFRFNLNYIYYVLAYVLAYNKIICINIFPLFIKYTLCFFKCV